MQEEVPLDEDEDQPEDTPDEDEDETVEEEDEEEEPKTKKVDKTVWDWTLVNDNKPLWTRKYVVSQDAIVNVHVSCYCVCGHI